MDRVSFLIAAYNEEDFLRECVYSCLNQQGVEVEVCVVDDGSSDSTKAIIQEMMSDPRVKGGFLASNEGKVAAFNRAYSMATGQYVALVGADDVNVDTRSVLSISRLKREEANLVYGDYYICDENLKVHGVKRTGDDVRLADLAFNNRISGGTMMFDRLVCDKAFPIPTSLRFEDWQIAFVSKLYFKVVKLDVPILYYRHHGHNDSANGLKLLRSKKKDFARHSASYAEFLKLVINSRDVPHSIVERLHESAFFKRLYIQDGLGDRLKIANEFLSTRGCPRTRVGWCALLGILPFGPGLFDLAAAAKEFLSLKRN